MMRRDVLPTDSRTSNSRAKVLGDQLTFSKSKVGLETVLALLTESGQGTVSMIGSCSAIGNTPAKTAKRCASRSS
jgi:hypothetical protein